MRILRLSVEGGLQGFREGSREVQRRFEGMGVICVVGGLSCDYEERGLCTDEGAGRPSTDIILNLTCRWHIRSSRTGRE